MTAEYIALGDEPGLPRQRVSCTRRTMTTTMSRVPGGETLATDGPFADTKEVFGGYYVYELDDLDAAMALAERIPALRLGRRGRGPAAGGAEAA